MSSDASEKCHALFVLTSLVRGNHAAAKTLIAFLSKQKRRRFFAEEGAAGDKAQVRERITPALGYSES